MLFVLIIGIIGIIARKEPITRSNLRDLAPQLRIAKFNTDIDSIIDEVVRCASANLTKYTIGAPLIFINTFDISFPVRVKYPIDIQYGNIEKIELK